jgi:hypothetical protein
MANDSIEQAVAATVIKLRKCGTPTSAANWRVVYAMLIPCSDEALEEFARQGRMLGVGWIVPVAEGLLQELGSGRAYRDPQGAIRHKERPKASGLQHLLN